MYVLFKPACKSKVVTHGAVLLYINCDNHKVTMQVAHLTYGIICAVLVKANNKEHTCRKHLWETNLIGKSYIPGYFKVKLHKVGPFFQWCMSY